MTGVLFSSLHYKIMWWMNLVFMSCGCIVSVHGRPANCITRQYLPLVLNDALLYIACGECLCTIHSQPSYFLTIQYHPLLFGIMHCQPAMLNYIIWVHMNSTWSTLLLSNHSISCNHLGYWMICQPAILNHNCECISRHLVIHSQPSYCLTIQYRTMWS